MAAKILQRPTLILNRNWQPVNVATVARALVLLWNEAARVVDPDTYQLFTWTDWSKVAPRDGDAFIQAVRLRLRVPEVIVLAEYDRLPSAAVSFSRRNIFKRDHWTCQYCGVQPGGEERTGMFLYRTERWKPPNGLPAVGQHTSVLLGEQPVSKAGGRVQILALVLADVARLRRAPVL